jgi:hypothetical protein
MKEVYILFDDGFLYKCKTFTHIKTGRLCHYIDMEGYVHGSKKLKITIRYK